MIYNCFRLSHMIQNVQWDMRYHEYLWHFNWLYVLHKLPNPFLPVSLIPFERAKSSNVGA